MANRTDITKCHRLRTALPLERGNIQGMTEKAIAESSDYMLTHIPQGTYGNGEGLEPYHVRWGVPPIPETQYFDPRGNPELTVDGGTMTTRGPDGFPREVTTTVNNVGALGCAPPSTDIGAFGFDTFTRDLKMNKWRIGPMCIWDFIDHSEAQIAALRKALHTDWPQMLRDNFEYELRRRVINTAQFNYTSVAGMPYGQGGFVSAPNGQLDLGMVRRIVNGPMKAHGWRGGVEVSVSETAFETMRLNYKNLMGLTLESTLMSTETHYIGDVKRISWGGITWVINPEPMRGYFVNAPSGQLTFVPIYPKTYREGTGAGLVPEYNSGYDDPYVFVDGQRHKVYEVTMAVHSTFAERQAMGLPAILDRSWSKNLFNFEVEVIDRNNGGLTECNEDNMKWAWLIRHVYGWQPKNPELAFTIVHEVAPNVVNIVSVDTQFPSANWLTGPGAVAADINVQEPAPPGSDACALQELADCDDVDQTNNNLVPNVTIPLPEGLPPAANLGKYLFVGGTPVLAQRGTVIQIPVQRVEGVLGTFTVTITPTAGTATAGGGNDYTAGATVLTWADGEGGVKYAPIPILSTATPGQSLTAVATGTPTSSDGTTAVTITIVS